MRFHRPVQSHGCARRRRRRGPACPGCAGLLRQREVAIERVLAGRRTRARQSVGQGALPRLLAIRGAPDGGGKGGALKGHHEGVDRHVVQPGELGVEPPAMGAGRIAEHRHHPRARAAHRVEGILQRQVGKGHRRRLLLAVGRAGKLRAGQIRQRCRVEQPAEDEIAQVLAAHVGDVATHPHFIEAGHRRARHPGEGGGRMRALELCQQPVLLACRLRRQPRAGEYDETRCAQISTHRRRPP